MIRLLFAFLLFPFTLTYALDGHESYILLNATSNEVIHKQGDSLDEQASPFSTFKIVLCLMGFDAGILINEDLPEWDFHIDYDDYMTTWKSAQTPTTWITHSCLWYSKILASHLGLETIQHYLTILNYGNQDMSGGLTKAWISSSLTISSNEQIQFLQRMLRGDLGISQHALTMTKKLLFIEELPEGWKLFGKTGSGSLSQPHTGDILPIGWFVGWIERGQHRFPFAYQIRGKNIPPSQRILRVKYFLMDSMDVIDEMGSIDKRDVSFIH